MNKYVDVDTVNRWPPWEYYIRKAALVLALTIAESTPSAAKVGLECLTAVGTGGCCGMSRQADLHTEVTLA